MIQILLQIGADCLSLQERHQKLLGNFVEVHPANTSNVDEVVKKKKWLDVWLKTNALDLKAMMAGTSYYWIASGKVAILPNSPQARKIAKNKLVLCKELNLD